MSINPFYFSPLALGAFSDSEDHLGSYYPTTDSESSISINNMFFPEPPETHDPLLDPYGEIDLSIYEYNNPFSSFPIPSLDHDNMSSVGTVDEPFSPISDAGAVGPSVMPSVFKLSSQYELGHTHIPHNFHSLNLQTASPGTLLSGLPDTQGLYDPLYGYGHMSHFASGAATDVPGHTLRSQGVDVSVGQVPLTFTFPPAPVIADQEHPSTTSVTKEESESSPTASTPRRVTRCKTEPTGTIVPDEDSDSDDKPPKRGKPEYRCPSCSSVFDRSYNRNKHVASVHEGKKDHVCPHAKCAQAFARKHDLRRHIQSFHTDLGSPRRNPPASGEQAGRAGKQKN
ncbi:hypothetical protein V8D89_002653 [Ganoderma adspersum]